MAGRVVGPPAAGPGRRARVANPARVVRTRHAHGMQGFVAGRVRAARRAVDGQPLRRADLAQAADDTVRLRAQAASLCAVCRWYMRACPRLRADECLGYAVQAFMRLFTHAPAHMRSAPANWRRVDCIRLFLPVRTYLYVYAQVNGARAARRAHRRRPELDHARDRAQRAQRGRVQVIADGDDGPEQRLRRGAAARPPPRRRRAACMARGRLDGRSGCIAAPACVCCRRVAALLSRREQGWRTKRKPPGLPSSLPARPARGTVRERSHDLSYVLESRPHVRAAQRQAAIGTLHQGT